VADSGVAYDGEYQAADHRTRAGWLHLQVVPFEGGVAAALRDITDTKAAEVELRRARDAAEAANLAKGEFLTRVNHELRTPLTAIIGFSKILRHTTQSRLAARELGYLDRVVAQGDHLLALVNSILDLAKIEAGKLEAELSPVRIDELVAETLAPFELQAHGKGVALRAELPTPLAPCESDPLRLKQVLINLVGNALKFTERGAVTVRVLADAAGTPSAIEVADTGIGIAPERQPAVFEAFEQADASTHSAYGGTGLGLSISRGMCELLGARLELESEEGVGSTFRIVLGAGVGGGATGDGRRGGVLASHHAG
jgi:signal transduction histidine kinase